MYAGVRTAGWAPLLHEGEDAGGPEEGDIPVPARGGEEVAGEEGARDHLPAVGPAVLLGHRWEPDVTPARSEALGDLLLRPGFRPDDVPGVVGRAGGRDVGSVHPLKVARKSPHSKSVLLRMDGVAGGDSGIGAGVSRWGGYGLARLFPRDQ